MSENPADILERIHRDAATLRSIGGGSLIITIEPAPAATAASRPVANGRTRRSPEIVRERERLVVAALGELGQATARDVGIRAALEQPLAIAALKRLEVREPPVVYRAGLVGGGHRMGRPSVLWELTDAGLTDAGLTDVELAGAQLPAPSSREQAERTDRAQRAVKSRRAEVAQSEDAKRILQALKGDDFTALELAEELSLKRARVTAILARLSKAGYVDRGGERDNRSIWCRRLLPEEQEDVTIRNGNGACSRTQVVECLRQGAASLRELADELGVRPSDVSLIAGPLEHEGLATRIADGKYRLLEAAA